MILNRRFAGANGVGGVMAEGDGLVKRIWAAQQRRFALWAPVLIGIGVWARIEGGVGSVPALWAVSVLAIGVLIALHRWRDTALAVVIGMILLVAAGYGAASLRIALVDAPVLHDGFEGAVTGRIVALDRSRSDAPRVVLDRLTLAGVHPSAVPKTVRVTLVDARDAPEIGAVISVRASLGPPSGPAAPGGFDFSRRAFFLGIGAVGYARGGVRVVEAADSSALWLWRLRSEIADGLRQRIGEDRGAVAAALIVGDRSGISDETTEALRDSGLAHLLAISGLHIGLMSALSFWIVRAALALMPVFASRMPIRKIAAVAGLLAAAAYLALAGFGIATQRAFIMAAVAFGAILLDRPAVTARGLAAAACLVLLFRPESLFQAGFQMSFAAVAALVAGYEAMRPFWQERAGPKTLRQRFVTGLVATVVTSVVAGLATAPFAAWHFNRLVAYGLAANVLATPVMGLWIMPAIIVSAVLVPFGLEGIGLAVLAEGIGYVLAVSETVAGWEGAAMSVPGGTPVSLALVVFGGLWLVIWRGWLRLAAILPILAGLSLWAATPKPDLMIAERAQLIGGRTAEGALWISREKKSGYVAETWLRRDGDAETEQADAYARRRWRCGRETCEGETTGGVGVILLRRQSASLDREDCRARRIIIAPRAFLEAAPVDECTIIDRRILDGASSVAVTFQSEGPPRIAVARPSSLGQ